MAQLSTRYSLKNIHRSPALMKKVDHCRYFSHQNEKETSKTNINFEISVDDINKLNKKSSEQSLNWKIIKNDKGYGLYSTKDIQPFSLVFSSRMLEAFNHRNSHSIQKDWNKHIKMDTPAILINHSCDANIGILDNEYESYDFYSLKYIPKGVELTWDYGGAEFHSMSFKDCLCGASNCRGENIGFEAAYEIIRKQTFNKYYAGYLHDYGMKMQ